MPGHLRSAAIGAVLGGLAMLIVLHNLLPASAVPVARVFSAPCSSRVGAVSGTSTGHFWLFVGVTSEARLSSAATVDRTWATLVSPPLRWYVDNETTLLGEGAVVVRDATYRQAFGRGEGYKHMSFKLQWVWQHVAATALSSSSVPGWFVRVWDDSYVFVRALRKELQLYHPDEPILVGHRHHTQGGFSYPDGGNPWCLSRAALRLWHAAGIGNCMNGTLTAEKARSIFGPSSHAWANCRDSLKPGLWCAEDIFLFYCLRQLGVRFVHYRGNSWPSSELGRPSFDPMLARSSRAETDPDHLLKPDYYAALHPVTPSMMKLLWSKEKKLHSQDKSQ